jgi:hypothetical protein
MGSLIAQGMAGVVLPALLALILSVLVLRIARLGEDRKWAVIGLVIVACFVFSFGVAFGGFPFPPREATHWLPLTAIGAFLFGLLLLLTRGVTKALARLIVAVATGWVLLQSQILGNWSLPLSTGWLVLIAGILFLTSALIERWATIRNTPVEALLGMALTAGFGGIALFVGGSALLGQIGGAFGLVLGAVTVAAFLNPLTTLGPVVPMIFTLIFAGLLLDGSLYSDLPWPTTGLLWVAPFAALVGLPVPPVARSKIKRLIVRGFAVLFVIAVAFAALFLIAPPSAAFGGA